jgi:RNA polymerase sigma-70 factor (ECF subfamily)
MLATETGPVGRTPVAPRAPQSFTPREEPEPESSEARLLAGLQSGDEVAFEVLVRTYGGRMLAVTRRLLQNEDDARDAVQEAFLCAFRSVQQFRGQSRLSTWLHRIAVNAALMKRRAAASRPETAIDPLLPEFAADGHHARPVETLPEAALMRREARQLVRAAIARLPENYRTVVLLRDIEELSTEETAQTLGITTTAVKLRLHRARQALRTLLQASAAAQHVPTSTRLHVST